MTKAFYVSGGVCMAEDDFMIVSADDARAYLKYIGASQRPLMGRRQDANEDTVEVKEAPEIQDDKYYPKLFIEFGRKYNGAQYSWLFELYPEFRVLNRPAKKVRGKKGK